MTNNRFEPVGDTQAKKKNGRKGRGTAILDRIVALS